MYISVSVIHVSFIRRSLVVVVGTNKPNDHAERTKSNANKTAIHVIVIFDSINELVLNW